MCVCCDKVELVSILYHTLPCIPSCNVLMDGFMSAILSPNSSLVSIASILRVYLYIYKKRKERGRGEGRERKGDGGKGEKERGEERGRKRIY